MQLYTLTPTFMRKDLVENFISAIWTERYFSAGDVSLVAPATPDLVEKLAHGTFLGLKGTKEVMLLDTQSIENGLLTVTGQSLVKFLDERPAWFENPDPSADQGILALTADITAGELISEAVNRIVINPIEFAEGPAAQLNLNWARETIPGLELGVVDANGDTKRLTLDLGTLYNSIESLAKSEGVGIKLYLDSARSSTGPVLKFATYRGKDRTSGQTTHSLVRLTTEMDSLSDVKEVSSRSSYKNVVYVVYHGMTIHYAEPALPIPLGFNRRVMVVQPEDIYLDPERFQAYRDQVARDTFANNNYVQTVDGQASPSGIYQFTVDYDLGDIIELKGLSGILSKARVTEYIRSQDRAGEREYPTLSVLDPLSTDFMPDTEPGDLEPPGTGDPVFDPDVTPDPEPGPDTGDPNTDPNPEFPDTDPNVDGPPDTSPDPIIIVPGDEPTVDNGNEKIYEQPVSDRFPETPTGYYTLRVTSRIQVSWTVPAGMDEWDIVESSGPIFSVVISNVILWDLDPMAPDSNSGHWEDFEPVDFHSGSSFSAYFVGTVLELDTNSLQADPLHIPKYPQSSLFAIHRYMSGPAVWTPKFGPEDKVTNTWQAGPGQIAVEIVHHPF